MYTFPHSQGIWYTPGILRPKSSLAVLSNCLFFFFGTWTVLILYYVRSLLILLDMACWYGSTAVPANLLFFSSGFCLGCSAHLISLLLYPFLWKVSLRCWISFLRLSGSQRVLACWINMVSTAHFCARWSSDLVCM
jgi:hypothetical protein